MTDGKGPDEIDDVEPSSAELEGTDEAASFDDEEAAGADATSETEVAEDDGDEDEDDDETDSGRRGVLPPISGRPAASTAAGRAAAAPAGDELPYVDDRFSKYWVAAIVATFAVILLYALLFGKAGFFTRAAPPESPTPIVTPGASPSPSPTHTFIPPTPERSASPALSPSALPSSTSTGASPSPVPSPQQSASPVASQTAGPT